jgi:hypothetical protein
MNGRAIDFRNIRHRAEMSTHVRVCSTTPYEVIRADNGRGLPATSCRPSCHFPIPVLPDLVSLSLHQCPHSSRSLHHIWRSYDGDNACVAKALCPRNHCRRHRGRRVSLLFHAADDAHSAVPVGSSRPFQATICALLRFNVIFYYREPYTVPVSLREMIILYMIHRSKKNARLRSAYCALRNAFPRHGRVSAAGG